MKQTTIYDQYEHKLKAEFLKVFHSAGGRINSNHFGPKIYTEYQKQMLVLLYRRAGKSYRRFIEHLFESRWPKWLGLREIPGKSSVHRWMQQFPLKLLKRLHKISLRKEQPTLMALDATGVDSWQRSRHYERRIGEPMLPYAKLDVLIDVDTQLIHDYEIRMKPRHDAFIARRILKRNRFRATLLGDKGYDSEPLHEIARENGLELYAPVRASPRKRPKGFYRRRCLKGNAHYPRRNVVESFFHSLKAVNLPALRSRLHWMKKKEMAVVLLVYNLEKRVKLFLAIYLHIIWD